ncbi:MAG: TVP38/TMEM64 family protein [Clostridia bacterium]|nr:TVP38/TMEM64 family protein [Clostridia bacterium]
MEKFIKKQKLNQKQKKRVVLTLVLGVLLLAACVLLYNLLNYALTIGIISVAVATVTLTLFMIRTESVFKILTTMIYVGLICVIVVIILDWTGFIHQFDSTEAFVAYINNSGGVAELLFLLIQFLQVTLIPIPSTITTVGATLLFPQFWKAFILSTSGLVIGSMLAFFLGRVFGVRLANWLVGEEAMQKYQKFMKGKDKIILFYMFIFPFFPDDFLCLLAGLTNMSYFGFFIMMIVTRSIGTAGTIVMAKGIFSIPLVGWGIPIWIALILVVFALFVLTIKYSAQIETFMMKLIEKMSIRGKKRNHIKNNAKPIEVELECVADTDIVITDVNNNDSEQNKGNQPSDNITSIIANDSSNKLEL